MLVLLQERQRQRPPAAPASKCGQQHQQLQQHCMTRIMLDDPTPPLSLPRIPSSGWPCASNALTLCSFSAASASACISRCSLPLSAATSAGGHAACAAWQSGAGRTTLHAAPAGKAFPRAGTLLHLSSRHPGPWPAWLPSPERCSSPWVAPSCTPTSNQRCACKQGRAAISVEGQRLRQCQLPQFEQQERPSGASSILLVSKAAAGQHPQKPGAALPLTVG